MRFSFALSLLLAFPSMVQAVEFKECSEWLKTYSEMKSVGKKRGGMIGLGQQGDVEILRPDLLAERSTEGNRSTFRTAIIPEIQEVLNKPENTFIKGKMEARDEVVIERDSSGWVSKIIVKRAIKNFEMIKDKQVEAYYHIQEISLGHDQNGCYPLSRTAYRKIGDLKEPDSSETFTFDNCAELQRLKTQIGSDEAGLKLPEQPLCRRLLSAFHRAEGITGSGTIRRHEALCSDRKGLSELVTKDFQCQSIGGFVSPRLERGGRSVSGQSTPSAQRQ